MSTLGHKRTFSEVCAMSALPPKADIGGATLCQKRTKCIAANGGKTRYRAASEMIRLLFPTLKTSGITIRRAPGLLACPDITPSISGLARTGAALHGINSGPLMSVLGQKRTFPHL